MAQRSRSAKQIAEDDFERITDAVLKEDKELLEMLAKV
jgi:hypothetical protein